MINTLNKIKTDAEIKNDVLSERVQIKKDGHAASAVGSSKVATGNSFGVIPEVKTF
jgi:hypothetical protein